MRANYSHKLVKRLASIILSVVIVFSIVPTAFAAEAIDREKIPYDELIEEGYSREEIDKVVEMMESYEETNPDDESDSSSESGEESNPEDNNNISPMNNDIVARVSVVARVEFWGHTWIYVENLTDDTIQVGHYSVPAGEGVSVGLFSFTCDDGIGIYYNVEAYCCNVHGGEGLVSLSTDVNAARLKKLSDELLDYPNHWDPFFNCMYFTFKMWNRVSDKKLVPLVIPAIGKLQIRIRGGKANNLDMYCPRADQVLRLKGGLGKEKVLVPVSASSIDQQIGG